MIQNKQPPLFIVLALHFLPSTFAFFLFSCKYTSSDSLLFDLVDSLTRSDSFVFLRELFDNKRLFELRDFLIVRVMSRDETVEQFPTSMYLVLDLADKYPLDSLAAHILDCVAQFLPVLICPCTHRGRVRQIISSVKRFQSGAWKGLWETALRLARWETDTTAKRSHNRAKRDKSSIQARVVPLCPVGGPL